MTKIRGSLLVLAVCAASLLSACQDTKARQENEQLRTQVADLQKELGGMGNRVEEAQKIQDDLTKQNAALREENNRLKGKRGATRPTKSRRRHRRSA